MEQEVRNEVKECGAFEKEITVGSTSVDMYAKMFDEPLECGVLNTGLEKKR